LMNWKYTLDLIFKREKSATYVTVKILLTS